MHTVYLSPWTHVSLEAQRLLLEAWLLELRRNHPLHADRQLSLGAHLAPFVFCAEPQSEQEPLLAW